MKSIKYYICMTWKNSVALEKKFKKWIQLQNFYETLLKIVILISSQSFLCLSRGYLKFPSSVSRGFTKFQAIKNSLAQRSTGNNF